MFIMLTDPAKEEVDDSRRKELQEEEDGQLA